MPPESAVAIAVPLAGEDCRRPEARLVSPASTGVKFRRLLWAGVEGTLFRYSFHTMNRWRTFLLRLFGAQVAGRCIIRRTVRIYYPWNLRIGALCVLGDRAEIYSVGPIALGDRVTISQEGFLCAGSHDYRDPAMGLLVRPITIGADAWVCARAFIGPGVTVGEGAIVSACGVAMKDVPPWTIVGGNPAIPLRDRPRFPPAPEQ
jgi:putative colanic acid biosynthesis acetyltransferase WcaF